MRSLILRVENATVRYGAFLAVDNVNLEIEEGKLYSVIGPNGAGKTTLVNALSGLQDIESGKIFFYDEDITSLKPYARAMKGMGRSFQIVNIFPHMTVFENLRLAGQAIKFSLQPLWRSVGSYTALNRDAEEMLDFIGLTQYRDVSASVLSHGYQRSLELGISLMNNPRLLLLDEPTAGMGHHELKQTVDLIAKVAQKRTVILIEHRMDVVMSISDEIMVLVSGQVLCKGTPAEIRANPKVREVYLGDEEEDAVH
jgi:branched-chain amino acid transport system ATP-binding protein